MHNDQIDKWIESLNSIEKEAADMCNNEPDFKLASYISHITDYFPRTIEMMEYVKSVGIVKEE